MYAYRPKRKNTKAALLIAVLILISSVGFLFAFLNENAPYIVEFTALAAAAVAVLLAGRYVFREYIYAVEARGSGFDLVITELRGKAHKVVCRIDISDATEIVRASADTKRRLASRAKHMKHHDYCVDLGADDACYLFLSEEGKEVSIRFSPNGKLEELLRSMILPKGK